MYHSKKCFLTVFWPRRSIHEVSGVLRPLHACVIVSFSPHELVFALCVWTCQCWLHTSALVVSSCWVVPLSSRNVLPSFLVTVVIVKSISSKNCYPNFHSHGNLHPSLHFQSASVFRSEGSLLSAAYRWVSFYPFYSFHYFVSFNGSTQTIYIYVHGHVLRLSL